MVDSLRRSVLSTSLTRNFSACSLYAMTQGPEFPCDVIKWCQLSNLARLTARQYLRNEERYSSFLWRKTDYSRSRSSEVYVSVGIRPFFFW